jgi:hypothetical protein
MGKSGVSKDDLKKRLMGITSVQGATSAEVSPAKALSPPNPAAQAVQPVSDLSSRPIPQRVPQEIPQPLLFSRDQPPPETPAPIRNKSILENTPRKRKGMKSDDNNILKGLYLEKAVAKDLADFAGVLNMHESRLANSILKAAFADETAPEELIPFLRRVRAIQEASVPD